MMNRCNSLFLCSSIFVLVVLVLLVVVVVVVAKGKTRNTFFF